MKFYLSCILIGLLSSTKSTQIVTNSTRAEVPEKWEWYPIYHLSPPSGWMNDPNGLIFFDGYYHAFYQHNPDDITFGLMCWGHARSKDMITWEHLPVALRPSIEADENGCFSGSAVEKDGVLTLIYTGNGFGKQVQCLADTTDTLEYTKRDKVLDAPGNNPDFRDPKVWKEGDDWYMVVGIRENDRGQVLLYKSKDLTTWSDETTLAGPRDGMGYMWECPDFFPLGSKYVLMMSPQGIEAEGYNYRNLHQSGYYLGTWAPGQPFDIEEEFVEIDHGHDFYAPQSFVAPDGRRIMFAWLDMWESVYPEQGQGWAGQFSLPRVLTLEGNRIRVNPAEEIERYRLYQTKINDKVFTNEHVVLELTAQAMEIITEWNVEASKAERYGLRLGDKHLSEAGVYLYVDNQARRLVLDRRYAQYGLSGTRSIAIPEGNVLSLRVFFDSSSIEVFVNNGEATLSSRIYPLYHQRYLSLFADNGEATLTYSSRWWLGRNSA